MNIVFRLKCFALPNVLFKNRFWTNLLFALDDQNRIWWYFRHASDRFLLISIVATYFPAHSFHLTSVSVRIYSDDFSPAFYSSRNKDDFITWIPWQCMRCTFRMPQIIVFVHGNGKNRLLILEIETPCQLMLFPVHQRYCMQNILLLMEFLCEFCFIFSLPVTA